jgi:ribosomal protein L37E
MSELIEVETMTHWWCRRCGRWEVCDDRDHCIECAYMVGGRQRGNGRSRRSVDGDSAASPARASTSMAAEQRS